MADDPARTAEDTNSIKPIDVDQNDMSGKPDTFAGIRGNIAADQLAQPA